MTPQERLALCIKQRDGYEAERIGLVAALLKMPIKREAFKDEWKWTRYEQGYQEMLDVLKVEGVGK